jgi:hypothetical protein
MVMRLDERMEGGIMSCFVLVLVLVVPSDICIGSVEEDSGNTRFGSSF